MDFFKRNIILLAKFSIVILYMIIPAYTDDTQLCLDDISNANFNIDAQVTVKTKKHKCTELCANHDHYKYNRALSLFVNYAANPRDILYNIPIEKYLIDATTIHVEAITTPFAIAYRTLLSVLGVQMGIRLFCFWINDPNLDSKKLYRDPTLDINEILTLKSYYNLPQIWKYLIQTLSTYTYHIDRFYNQYYKLCLVDLDNDDFNINSKIDSSRYTKHRLPKDIDDITTPYGIAYYYLLYFYEAKTNPKIFCSWIIDQDNKSFAEINMDRAEYEMPVIWENLIRDLTNKKYIGTCQNLHYNLCLSDIDTDFNFTQVDSFDMNDYRGSFPLYMEISKSPEEYFITPFGKAYRNLLHVHKRKMFRKSFCSWINLTYDTNLDDDLAWFSLKAEITYDICIHQLKFDKFYVATSGASSSQSTTSEQPKTWHGKEYGKVVTYAEHRRLHPPTAEDFCENFREEYMSQLKNPSD